MVDNGRRIYNKSLQMRVTEEAWSELLWQGAERDRPVWRIEFQFRSRALRSLGIAGVPEVLDRRQDLWEYGTRWLSLRRRHRRRDLLEVFTRRYEVGACIVSSNWPVEDWGQVLGDTAASGAILDRFLHCAELTPPRKELPDAYCCYPSGWF